MAVHSSYSVPEKSTTSNINIIGDMMYPFLNSTLKSMDVSILTMMRLTIILLYMRLIDENSLGGAPYFPVWFQNPIMQPFMM